MDKGELERAEEHVKVAEEIIYEVASSSEGESQKALEDAAISLERAEADISDTEKNDSCTLDKPEKKKTKRLKK